MARSIGKSENTWLRLLLPSDSHEKLKKEAQDRDQGLIKYATQILIDRSNGADIRNMSKLISFICPDVQSFEMKVYPPGWRITWEDKKGKHTLLIDGEGEFYTPVENNT